MHRCVCASLLQICPVLCTCFGHLVQGMDDEGRMVCSGNRERDLHLLFCSPLLPPPRFYTVLLRTAKLHTLHSCQTAACWDERVKGAQAATDPPALVMFSASPSGGPAWGKALPVCIFHLHTEILSMGMLLMGLEGTGLGFAGPWIPHESSCSGS